MFLTNLHLNDMFFQTIAIKSYSPKYSEYLQQVNN